ncbi:NADH dehydrogenase ubiquinone 1 alpha subcomplex subunit 6 [Cavenderia fasciculata]|uniref:NADH dehydrogenase ubiquinone 1 alpha subcomplex subunit 6 n=1 Tax=Cavenderia fasciculata TaxID=261658 RepID=F4PSF5_CACFS|nr:NADH dehydrogenase ubiquinone 1 alpha subcomplex subunit 6 [Cavenderia fasciculata]EGG21485.1 NADH dehydrogenase ubiquinone 1 alpha subcomplex subunit 6 [Cavenderia fasciculata]|eukprot:XP_004359335.1 NADH dehydrogenase ubiquinone 1 alpha subcomplex subunit 6 [Cavenderia fasciculata]
MSSNLIAIKTLRPAFVSSSFEAARSRSLKLYRNAIRSVPVLIQHYNLSYNISDMHARIKGTISILVVVASRRTDFRQFDKIEDKGVLDRLSFIGETELFDAVSLLKTRSHVVNYFDEIPNSQNKKQISEGEDLLKKFFSNI